MILRELWRDRLSIVLCASLAIIAGVLVAYRPALPPSLESRKYEVGTASARILLDTPASQVIALAPKSGENLGAHASLLANLMGEGEVKAAIAKRAGLDQDRLLTVTPSAAESGSVSPAQLRNPRANIVKIRALTNDTGEQLPIIDVDAQAPDARGAAALANATVSGLAAYLDHKATVDGVSESRRLRVRALGTSQGSLISRGPGGLIGVIVSIVLFATLSGLVLFAGALGRGWRAASDAEDAPSADAGVAARQEPHAAAGNRAERAAQAAVKPVTNKTKVSIVRELMAEDPARDWAIKDLLATAAERGWVTDESDEASLRTTASKLCRRGELVRPATGVYRLAESQAPSE